MAGARTPKSKAFEINHKAIIIAIKLLFIYIRRAGSLDKLNFTQEAASPGLRRGSRSRGDSLATVVFWPLMAGLAYVVLLSMAWWILLLQVGKRDDP